MPQFEFATVFWPQLIWLSIIFAVLFFGVVMPTLPKIARVVDEREGKVASDLSQAETAKASADAMADTYAEGIAAAQSAARSALATAKATSAKDAESALALSNAAIDEKLALAEAELNAAKASAFAEIENIASDASAAIVEKLTGQRIAMPIVQTAVQSALARN